MKSLSPTAPNPPRSCCLLRLSALGDVTHTLPLLRALQHHWPQCELSWIIGRRERELLGTFPGVNFIIFDKRAGKTARQQLKQQLSGLQFDVLLHLQTSLRSHLLSTYIKAHRRIGWDSIRAREGQRWFVNEQLQEHPPQHQVQGFLAFARHLGLDAQQPCWDLPIAAQDHNFARKVLPGDQPTLLISPCSSHELRDWPAQRYQAVARYAIEHLRLRVIVCGGPSERELAYGSTIAQAHPEIINFVGRDTLPQMAALCQRAAVVLSPDSGPAHIANALGTPVIGLHAATWSQRSGPYNSLTYCVDRFDEAAKFYRRRAASELRWGTRIEVPGVMELIEVAAVNEQLKRIYQEQIHTGTDRTWTE